MTSLAPNETFTLAADIIRNTSQSVFLTGKAGTGKTTFLHHIRSSVDKNIIVAAPTGVAAINAGGVTLHSLLQLPFEPFIPNFEGKKKLDYHFKMRKSKIEMLRELDLLIIDEVSMLRADTLDAIDHLLRRYRHTQEPFGGVQMLFIGDMFQLPPVVQPAEWEELKHYYPSPFFFHAQALENNMPLYIELKTIYRQSDRVFIDILNNIRNNRTTAQDLATLNKRYNPSFDLSASKDKYVVLCTHNYKADRINSEELQRLDTPSFTYHGQIRGDFAENSLPTDAGLNLKVGAQVMFIRNDAGEQRRYYNGKLAIVSYLDDEKIFVRFADDSELEVEHETWRNVRYTLNDDSGEIEEEELGSFTQYPIRLAWAITIHKSQGLTFDHVVIDAGQAFAAGQVYVALSRCTSLDGIVLFSRIVPASIQTDAGAIDFARQEKDYYYLQAILQNEKPRYCAEKLIKAFDWAPMVRTLRSFYELASEKKIPDREEVLGMVSQMCNKAVRQEEIAKNFRKELALLLAADSPDIDRLSERVKKAAVYFHSDIQQSIMMPAAIYIDKLKNASKVKLYLKGVRDIYTTLQGLLSKLEHIHYGDVELTEGLVFEQLHLPQNEKPLPEATKEKPKKGDSKKLSFELFSQGMSVKDIAKERNLTAVTVEGHLVSFISTGELDVYSLVSETKVKKLIPLLSAMGTGTSLSVVKEQLPPDYTYFDIKAVLNHLQYIQKGE